MPTRLAVSAHRLRADSAPGRPIAPSTPLPRCRCGRRGADATGVQRPANDRRWRCTRRAAIASVPIAAPRLRIRPARRRGSCCQVESFELRRSRGACGCDAGGRRTPARHRRQRRWRRTRSCGSSRRRSSAGPRQGRAARHRERRSCHSTGFLVCALDGVVPASSGAVTTAVAPGPAAGRREVRTGWAAAGHRHDLRAERDGHHTARRASGDGDGDARPRRERRTRQRDREGRKRRVHPEVRFLFSEEPARTSSTVSTSSSTADLGG